jgi:hypothetical protein
VCTSYQLPLIVVPMSYIASPQLPRESSNGYSPGFDRRSKHPRHGTSTLPLVWDTWEHRHQHIATNLGHRDSLSPEVLPLLLRELPRGQEAEDVEPVSHAHHHHPSPARPFVLLRRLIAHTITHHDLKRQNNARGMVDGSLSERGFV